MKQHCSKTEGIQLAIDKKRRQLDRFYHEEGRGYNRVKYVDGREKDPPSKWMRRWPQTALRGELQKQIKVPPKEAGQNVE